MGYRCRSSLQPVSQKQDGAKKATTLEELQGYFPELKIIIDVSEQKIPKTKKQDKEKDALFRQEKEAHRQESACSKPTG